MQTILITGANRGIGRALVDEALARGAARVYAAGRRPTTHPDERVTPLVLDVTSDEQVAAAAAQVEQLDVLVNNAGAFVPDDLGDASALERHLAVNLFGIHRTTLAFVPHLLRSRGALVNNLSLNALAPLPGAPAYSVSKAAAFSLTRSQRILFTGTGVRVHAVLTGPTDTDMVRELDVPKAPPAEVAAAILDAVAAGQEDVFPDAWSRTLADAWRTGPDKELERQLAPDYTTSFTVEQDPDEVFRAILDVGRWWTGEVTGSAEEFRYRYADLHDSVQKMTEHEPGRRVAWHVTEANLDEWPGTDLVFDLERRGTGTEVRFTHRGLRPGLDCWDRCSPAWTFYLQDSLRRLVTTGEGPTPTPWA